MDLKKLGWDGFFEEPFKIYSGAGFARILLLQQGAENGSRKRESRGLPAVCHSPWHTNPS